MFTNKKKLLQNGWLMSSMDITCVMLTALIMIFLGMPLKASAGSTVIIRNNMDYAGFCTLVSLDPSTSATLENDLTIDDHTGTIIGESRYNPYTGVFDGNGHTITIKKASSGFIHCLGEKDGDIGEVRDLNVVIENTSRLDGDVVGGIVDINRGKIITGCTVEIPKNGLISGYHVGGIVGENWSSVENSTVVNNGTLSASGNLACGGIAGIDHSKIQNCVARGNGEIKIQGSGGVGGIAGYTFGRIIGCITEGKLILTGNANNSSIGGIAGIIDFSACCENDLVYGDVTINYPAANTRAGGIVGYMKDKDGNNSIKYCFYNSTKSFDVMLDTANPILGDAAGGWLEQCYYNMDTTGKPDTNGIGVGNIYWADTHDLMVKFPDSIDAGDGILCAGRYFYFKGKGIPVKYRGILVLGQSIAYIVNGNGTSYEVNSDEIVMPEYDIVISSVLKNDISMIHPTINTNTFTYDGTPKKPTQVNSDIGLLTEGTDYTVSFRDSDGKKIDECINVGKYTMTIWGAGARAGHVDKELTIAQAKPSFTVTADTMRDDLDISDVVLKRSDESVEGELKLIETELLYGTNTYHWKFTPSDTHNYESVSGTVEITVTGHEWIDATCTEPKTCSRCGATEGKPLGHSFTKYESNNNATCTADGTKTAKCDRCDETDTKTDEGSALGHKWKPATCTEPKTCSRCDATEGEPLGHSFTKYESNNNATCTADGTKTAKCDRCDETDTKTDEGSAKGHDWIEATCTEPKKCSVCGAEEGKPAGHSFTKYVSNDDATCTEDGTKTAKCDRCDVRDTVKDTGSAKGHDWIEATCTEPKTCSRCHMTEGQPTGHTWESATCIAPKTCSICGATEGEPDPDAHDWADWQVTTEPAPDKNGVRTRVCRLDPSHKETERITASGKLLTKMKSKGKTSLVITWTKMKDAAGYEIYFARCNHKNKKNVCKKIGDVEAGKRLKYTKKKLKKQASYKAFVIAYTLVDGVKVYKDTSLTMHAYTSGRNKKNTNPAKVTVKKSKYTLDAGQTVKIKGKVTKPKKNKKLKISNHAPLLRYISSMKDVATVNKNGKIKARKKGSCKIYVIAVNGIRKTISVTVK